MTPAAGVISRMYNIWLSMYTMSYRCCAHYRNYSSFQKYFRPFFFIFVLWPWVYFVSFVGGHFVVVTMSLFRQPTHVLQLHAHRHTCETVWCFAILYYIYIQLYIKLYIYIYIEKYTYSWCSDWRKRKNCASNFETTEITREKKSVWCISVYRPSACRPPQNGFSAQHAKTSNRTVGRR